MWLVHFKAHPSIMPMLIWISCGFECAPPWFHRDISWWKNAYPSNTIKYLCLFSLFLDNTVLKLSALIKVEFSRWIRETASARTPSYAFHLYWLTIILCVFCFLFIDICIYSLLSYLFIVRLPCVKKTTIYGSNKKQK